MSDLPQLSLARDKCRIEDGDVLLFERRGLISLFGRSLFSHAALAGWWDHTLMCLEVREWYGGRAVTLASQVAERPGKIHVYRPCVSDVERYRAVVRMRNFCGRRYGWWAIAQMAALHTPGLRSLIWSAIRDRVLASDVRRDYSADVPLVCSGAIETAFDTDLVPNLAAVFVEPGDLGRSSSLVPQFVLVP